VLIWLHAGAAPAAFTVRLKVAVAVCAVGFVESVTVKLTEAVPAAGEAGVPVIAPVEALSASPLGSPVAL
jgi:hypothetical protein